MRATVADALAKIPSADGQRFARIFAHGPLEVEFYAPRGHDPQKPHSRDEVYIVVSGSGMFVNGDARYPFGPAVRRGSGSRSVRSRRAMKGRLPGGALRAPAPCR